MNQSFSASPSKWLPQVRGQCPVTHWALPDYLVRSKSQDAYLLMGVPMCCEISCCPVGSVVWLQVLYLHKCIDFCFRNKISWLIQILSFYILSFFKSWVTSASCCAFSIPNIPAQFFLPCLSFHPSYCLLLRLQLCLNAIWKPADDTFVSGSSFGHWVLFTNTKGTQTALFTSTATLKAATMYPTFLAACVNK